MSRRKKADDKLVKFSPMIRAVTLESYGIAARRWGVSRADLIRKALEEKLTEWLREERVEIEEEKQATVQDTVATGQIQLIYSMVAQLMAAKKVEIDDRFAELSDETRSASRAAYSRRVAAARIDIEKSEQQRLRDARIDFGKRSRKRVAAIPDEPGGVADVRDMAVVADRPGPGPAAQEAERGTD